MYGIPHVMAFWLKSFAFKYINHGAEKRTFFTGKSFDGIIWNNMNYETSWIW